MLKKLTLLTAGVATAFAMHTGELNINDKDLDINAKFDVGQFNTNVEPDTMFIGGRFFNANKDHAENKEKIDPYYELNFLMMRPIGNMGMSLGLGAKLNYTSITGQSFSSLPLGLEFAYKLPVKDFVPMTLAGSLYYAPQVLSFSDAKNYLEYRIWFDVEIIDNGAITLGYRNLNTNYDGGRGDFTYNSSAYIGFKIKF